MTASTVSRQVTMLWLGDPVPTTWWYDADDPYAVHVHFNGMYEPDDGEPLVWGFARSLLAQGLHGPAGEDYGDIRIWPAGGRVVLEISSPEKGSLRFSIDADRVRSFLSATYRAVQPGREWMDVDACITKLLAAQS